MTLRSQIMLYLRLINLEVAKQICQAIIAVFNVFEAWYAAHLTICTMYNTIV